LVSQRLASPAHGTTDHAAPGVAAAGADIAPGAAAAAMVGIIMEAAAVRIHNVVTIVRNAKTIAVAAIRQKATRMKAANIMMVITMITTPIKTAPNATNQTIVAQTPWTVIAKIGRLMNASRIGIPRASSNANLSRKTVPAKLLANRT